MEFSSKEESVRERYSRLTDDQLINIATKEAADLTELGYKVLQEEIQKRGLLKQQDLEESLKTEELGIEEKEFQYYQQTIESLPCPSCGSQHSKLRSKIIRQVASFILFTQLREDVMIGCEECLDKWNRRSRLKTYLLGWWGFPRGIMHTLSVISQNNQSESEQDQESEAGIEGFIFDNIGHLRAFKENKEKNNSLN